MINNTIIGFLNKNNVKYLVNEKTANFVSIKIGGTADLIAFPPNLAVFCNLICILKELNTRYFILGKGTNTYFSDNNFDGVIISTELISNIVVTENKIVAQCGALLNQCCRVALKEGLSGLEFAYGIPGSVGGAIYMNSSAFGESISNYVISSRAYDTSKNIITELDYNMHLFSDKSSVFQHGNLIVLETTLRLNKGVESQIKAKMNENLTNRLDTQPLNYPSAGSAFKRPKNNFASLLIDKAGLKGYRIGGAEVSRMHAGFIVNVDNATAQDINDLIRYIKNRIFTLFGVKLEEEIIFVE